MLKSDEAKTSSAHQSLLVPLTMPGKEKSLEKYSPNEYINNVIVITSIALMEVKRSVHGDNVGHSHYRTRLSNEE